MRTMRRWILVPALFAGLFLAASAPAAIVVAKVEDGANFFSAEAKAKANDLIKEIKHDFKEDLQIETFPAIPADRMEAWEKLKDKPEGRKQFFNDWAMSRAKAWEVDGVYLLICQKPGRVEFDVRHLKNKKAFTEANGKSLADIFLEKFEKASVAKDDAEKKKLHDQALIEGVEYVGRTMKANLGTKGSVGAAPAGGSSFNLGGLLCTLLVVGLVIWVVVALIRAFTGAGRSGYGAGYGPGAAQGMGGGPGYGGGGGGGGFMTGMLGGLFGAAAGSFLYDRFFRGDSGGGGWGGGSTAYGSGPSPNSGGDGPSDVTGGGDFGGDAGGGGGGGGDFGGDAGGGGGGGGGDFGGDAGGGGGGGGDFGGGGGDFGGGGGDF